MGALRHGFTASPFTLKKQFSTQGSFLAFSCFPPDRTHLSFISPFALSPVLLDLWPGLRRPVAPLPSGSPQHGDYPRETRQLGTLEW